jgi:hypothetical protein
MYLESFKPATTKNGHILNVVNDVPDFRDRMYTPSLSQLKPAIEPEIFDLKILNQGTEGSCTGQALAAVINLLLSRRGDDTSVSQRMLYEMAKKHDRWPGEGYEGSSCRGAIRGWYHMGVCNEDLWEYQSGSDDTHLNPERAKDARNITIGAYYRLNHDIVDFHCALNEVGVLYVSADVHSGWMENINGPEYKIPLESEIIGGHAFALVGYNEKGFLIQNSWGKDWGKKGVALWTYEDWQTNLKDAWVIRLAVPTPQIHRGSSGLNRSIANVDGLADKGVSRIEIAGHFAHIDDGNFDDQGKYWSNENDVDITASKLGDSIKYEHLLFYCHGGLNSPKSSAKRVKAMTNIFKDNGIYNYHFMYDTGLLEELKDIIKDKKPRIPERTAFNITDITDKLIENITRHIGKALWSEMKKDAGILFNSQKAGSYVAEVLTPIAVNKGMKIHIIGHSNGSVMAAYLIERLLKTNSNMNIATLNLMAPACTCNLFKNKYAGPIANQEIQKTTLYNLSDKLEQRDDVAKAYRKSLLYLVSNAYEGQKKVPLLGMEKFKDDIDVSSFGNRFEFVISKGREGQRSASRSHGGFDNDIDTLNDILKQVTGSINLKRPFKKTDLDY